MEKEFTDEEIMKALECCGIKQTCSECPYNNLEFGNCEDDIKADAFEVMSRDKEMIRALIAGQETLQKAMAEKDAEIERLKKGHILYECEGSVES